MKLFSAFCCFDISNIVSKQDEWSITTEARLDAGEKGAGWLYKRAKSKAIWNRRFFTLNGNKLVYYTEDDRLAIKGTIVIAGVTAQVSPTRVSTRDKKYFILSHPHCGIREFHAATNRQRSQWIETINNLSQHLEKVSIYGKLRKLGGNTRSSWQDRWAICVGRYFEYFNQASDNLARGIFDLEKTNVRECTYNDAKFCFELLVPVGDNTKRCKKYLFACEDERERHRWIEFIKHSKSNFISDSLSNNSNTVHGLLDTRPSLTPLMDDNKKVGFLSSVHSTPVRARNSEYEVEEFDTLYSNPNPIIQADPTLSPVKEKQISTTATATAPAPAPAPATAASTTSNTSNSTSPGSPITTTTTAATPKKTEPVSSTTISTTSTTNTTPFKSSSPTTEITPQKDSNHIYAPTSTSNNTATISTPTTTTPSVTTATPTSASISTINNHATSESISSEIENPIITPSPPTTTTTTTTNNNTTATTSVTINATTTTTDTTTTTATATLSTTETITPPPPNELCGYLEKKTNGTSGEYQRRYFLLRSPGEILYFMNEEDSKNDKDVIGIILLVPFKSTQNNGIKPKLIDYSPEISPVEFTIQLPKRSYQLRAESEYVAQQWIHAVDSWYTYRMKVTDNTVTYKEEEDN